MPDRVTVALNAANVQIQLERVLRLIRLLQDIKAQMSVTPFPSPAFDRLERSYARVRDRIRRVRSGAV